MQNSLNTFISFPYIKSDPHVELIFSRLIVESLKKYQVLLIETIYTCLTTVPCSLNLMEMNETCPYFYVPPSDMQFPYIFCLCQVVLVNLK